MSKGYLITFEGGDGCGKSTHFKLFLDFLTQNNIDFVSAREPGATPFAECIREITKSPKYADKSALSELLLFETSRADLTEKVILPALNKGKIVVLDRFYDSTLAYQGYGRGQNIKLLKELNKIAVNGVFPDLTLLYDVSTKTAQERVGSEKDRMESAGLMFYEKVKNGYIELQKENSDRIKLIDANRSVEEVFEDTKKNIVQLIQERRGK